MTISRASDAGSPALAPAVPSIAILSSRLFRTLEEEPHHDDVADYSPHTPAPG